MIPFLQSLPLPMVPNVVVTDLAVDFAEIVQKVWSQTLVVTYHFHIIGPCIYALENE